MSTVLNTNGESLEIPAAAREDYRVAVITAKWNPDVTHTLRDGAVDVLLKSGVKDSNIRLIDVPGTVELVNAAAAVMRTWRPEAVIVIGCVIRGDTPHFDYVCMQAAAGIAELNARGEAPVIFGVLTTDNLEQALQRAGGVLGNKGAEAACAAIEMANLHNQLEKEQGGI